MRRSNQVAVQGTDTGPASSTGLIGGTVEQTRPARPRGSGSGPSGRAGRRRGGPAPRRRGRWRRGLPSTVTRPPAAARRRLDARHAAQLVKASIARRDIAGRPKVIVARRPWRSISSAGGPESRTRPARIATTRSHRASASSSSWVTSSTVVPASRSCATAAHTLRRAAGSRPWVSSSRITRRGRSEQCQHQEQPLALPAAQRRERRAPPLAQPELLEQASPPRRRGR